MGVKKSYSKKLSKTIALAVMAMSVAGFASVASAEENEIIKTVLGNDAAVTGQYTASSAKVEIPNPFDKEDTLNVEKATITASSDLNVSGSTGLYSSKYNNTALDMGGNALTINSTNNGNGIIVTPHVPAPVMDGYNVTTFINDSTLTLNNVKSVELNYKGSDQQVSRPISGMDGSKAQNIGMGTFSVDTNTEGWSAECAPTYPAAIKLDTTGDVKVNGYAVGLASQSNGQSEIMTEKTGVFINAGGDVNLVGNGNNKNCTYLDGTERYDRFGSLGVMALGHKGNFPENMTGDDINKFYDDKFNQSEVNVKSAGDISITNYELGVVSSDGADVKLSAKGNITIDSLGYYGVLASGSHSYYNYNYTGNVELTSEEGLVKIASKGDAVALYNMNASKKDNGNITINGNAEITGEKHGIYSENTRGNINLNGDTKITSLSDTGVYMVNYQGASSKATLNATGKLEIDAPVEGVHLYGRDMNVDGEITILNANTGINLDKQSTLDLKGSFNTKDVETAFVGKNAVLDIKGDINIEAKKAGLSFEVMDFAYDKGTVNIIAPTAVCAKGQSEEKVLSAKELSWDDKWASDKEGFKKYCSESSDIGENCDGTFENVLSAYGLSFDEYYAACVEEQTLYPAIGAWNGFNFTMEVFHDYGALILAVAEKDVSVISWSTATLDLANAKGESVIKGDLVAEDGGKINILNAKNLTFEGKTVLAEKEGNSEINLDLSEGSVWTVTGDSQLTKLSGKDGVIKPGDYTVTTKAAAEGTSVNVVGESGELNDVAGKLFYTNYVNGENNLSAKAVIEGEAARESAEMLFKEDNGQGYIDENKATDTEIFGEYNESINKNTNVTVTETGTWTPTGENSVAGLKGEAGSAVDMTKANSLKVDSYSGETTMLYGHDESDPTKIIGGDVNIGKAEEGSKVTMSTDNKGINTEDNKQVAAVMNAMAQKLTYAEAAETADNTPVNNLSGKVQIAEGLTASSASIAAGDIKFDKEGKGSVDESTIENSAQKGDEETATMKAVKGALVSGALMMRAESNDLLKRMGDVRLAEEERGLWAKYYGGKYEMDKANAHVSYKAYQLGYDTKAGKNWTVGGAVSYNEGKDGKTELKNTAVGVYGTWADDKGQYIDLITKIGWLKNDFDVKAAGYQIADTMKNTGMSMSAEYGKRFENKAGSFLEPNAELTFGHLNGKKVNANVVGGGTTLGVDQDAFNSLVGRLGLRIGHKTAKSSVYAKVALAHEFAGDFDVTFSAPGEPTKATKVEFKDTWGEFQIGGTTKLGKAGLLYANYQRSFAGDVKEKYRVDAGLRWSF